MERLGTPETRDSLTRRAARLTMINFCSWVRFTGVAS